MQPAFYFDSERGGVMQRTAKWAFVLCVRTIRGISERVLFIIVAHDIDVAKSKLHICTKSVPCLITIYHR